jgi:hypothetical protein
MKLLALQSRAIDFNELSYQARLTTSVRMS